jgi:hypothetical protein
MAGMDWKLAGFVICMFVTMFWLCSFVAATLLCSPVLFKPLPRRTRLALPFRGDDHTEMPRPVDRTSARSHFNKWLYPLLPVFWVFMLVLTVLVIVPAIAAMCFCAVCMNFRYCRRATYRALRQQQAIFPFSRSYPVGLAILVRRIATSYYPKLQFVPDPPS